jgi:hypothetical protein
MSPDMRKGDRVTDPGGNGAWVRGVSADGQWAAVEFDDSKRQVINKRTGHILREFYWNDMLTPEEAGASDEEVGDYINVVHGLPPAEPAHPQAPAPDTEPPAEYGQNSAPVRKLRELFRNGEIMNGDALDEDQPEQGKQGETEIVTLSDGSKVVFKSQVPERNDREELSYYVSQALDKATGHDTGLPPVARNPDTPWEMVERVVPGKTGMRYVTERLAGQEDSALYYSYAAKIEQEIADTWNGHHIGLLDYVTSNSDRNPSNYLVDGRGSPTPIDMGMAQFDGDNYSLFWAGLEYSPASVARMETELRKLRPEFQRLGHEDWHVVMMDTVSRLQASPPGFAGRGEAIELTRSAAWLHELRDAHGEWSRTPGDKPGTGLDRYKVPPHERLINPHADMEDPADYPFFKKHPVSVKNIVDAYDATDPDTRDAGMKWYSDAHLLAKAMGMLGGGHGGNPDKQAELGAILLGNYSSSADWPVNMWRAARVAEDNKPIAKGDGYISGDQVKKATKALAGEPIDSVLTSPKTRSFAHLLAKGDDSPDDPYGHVVIDAHALNVAAGGTIRGATYARGKKQQGLPPEDKSPLDDARAHEYVGDQYRQAAALIRQRDHIQISPHQMQAVTWVAQVLKNQAEDKAAMETEHGGAMGRAKGRLANEVKDWKTWLAYARAHNFQLVPGVSALAAQALLAQVVELVGEDSVLAQLELAAWEHELRGPDGRWVKSPGSIGEQLRDPVEAQRSKHATEGELRLALIKSQVYTTQQFDKMQAEISHLQEELDKEGKDEAKAVLVTHLAWIGAGIAAALVLTGVGLPPAVALLAATLPTIGSEFSELAVVLGKGRRALAHPAAKVREILHQHKQHLAFASDPLHDQAVTVVAQWLAQTGYGGPDASDIADALVTSWLEENAGRVARARQRDMSGSLAVQALAGEPLPFDSITAQLMPGGVSTVDDVALAYDPAEPRDPQGKWVKDPLGEQLAKLAEVLGRPAPPRSAPALLPSPAEMYGGHISEDHSGHLTVDGQPVRKLYRVADPGEWAEAQRKGYLRSHGHPGGGRPGYTRASAAPDERWRYQGPQAGVRGVTLEIDYNQADGWHASAEGYAATNSKIPLSRVREILVDLAAQPAPCSDCGCPPGGVSTVDDVALAYDPAEPRDVKGRWKTYWHLTDNPDFRPSSDVRPVTGGGYHGPSDKPMLHATSYPSLWKLMIGGSEESVPYAARREWAAEVRPRPDHPSFAREVFPDPEVHLDPAKVDVLRIIPVEHAIAEETGYLGSKYVGHYRYPGPDFPGPRQADLVAQHAGCSDCGCPLGALDLAFNPLEPRGAHGEWEREAQYQAVLAERKRAGGYPVIGPEHARGNSRPVSHEEFQRLAHLGNQWIDRAKRDASPTTGLDRNWPQIRERAFKEAQKPWGGATINSHTGEFLPDGADLYALSVKPRGMVTISVPETSSQQEFEQAMDQARQMFGPALQRAHFHLGVFHDDEHHRIDIDPVAIVDSTDLVDQVGAYTRAIGGAYHFHTGNGHWPPHVAEGAGMANDDDQQVHFAGPGQWHTQAVEIQEPEPDDASGSE